MQTHTFIDIQFTNNDKEEIILMVLQRLEIQEAKHKEQKQN